jgi:tetratricopeptide (TPR) repeat protein
VAAEIAYRQAYLLDAASRDWKLGLAQALMVQEKYAEAASLLDSLISENANDKQLWLQQTNAYLAMDRKAEAAVNLEVLRYKGLADESNLNLLGNLYMDRSEPQLALHAYLAAIEQAKVFDSGRALKSARILNDYGFPDRAAEFLVKIRAKLGDKPSIADETALLLTEVRVAQSKRETARVGEILTRLLALDPVNGEVLLEMARHLSLQSADEADTAKRSELVQEARTNFQLAVKNSKVAYDANLGLGQMFVRERRHAEALPVLEAALTLKKSESLDQYVSRVRRAADRQKQKDEREAGK